MSNLPTNPKLHVIVVTGLLLVMGTLAVTSLVGDSVTFDETSHLPAGYSYLRTGDYRLAPDHPPLAKIWCAWPLLLLDVDWVRTDHPSWISCNPFGSGRAWLFEGNAGQRMVVVGRCMMVMLLVATGLAIYFTARELFGPAPALCALSIATFSPTLLAHGRLVTTDLPITLCITLTILMFARLIQRATWPRAIAAALALAAATVTKFSWPLVLPALLAMGITAVVISRKKSAKASGKPAGRGPVARRWPRIVEGIGQGLVIVLIVWLTIWASYQFRRRIVAPPPAAAESVAREQIEQAREHLARDWRLALHDADGELRRGLVPGALNALAGTGLLPDAYMLGLARTMATTEQRMAYLFGRYSPTGWWYYFPVAFVIKTPVSVMLLLVAGVLALVRRKVELRHLVLLVGLVTFAAVYVAYALSSHLNIGHRHLLPIYPVIFVFAGASVAWLAGRVTRWLVGAAFLWLIGASLWIHPHYLAYFNELVGGPSGGRLCLVDSNIDWGQDLRRLADYARSHPAEPIKLAYFGSAPPTFYVDCTALPSLMPFEPPADLSPGTYVVSATQLSGVYDLEVRDAFWDERACYAYAVLHRMATLALPDDAPPEMHAQQRQARTEFGQLRYKRLLNRLRHRPADDRIGHSLLVYRLLDPAELAGLLRP